MQNPKVSIIIPTHNRAGYISKAITSIIKQSYQDFEILIIDDGSTDNTKDIIQKFNDQRIHYFYYKDIKRLATLRNIGITLSKGSYIAFLDSDDIWKDKKLEIQINTLEANDNIHFSFTDVELFNQYGIIESSIYLKFFFSKEEYKGNFFNFMLKDGMVIYPSTFLFKKNILLDTGLLDDKNFKASDTAFILKIAYLYNGYIPDSSLVKICKHNTNMSSLLEYQKMGIMEILFSIKQLFEENKISKTTYLKLLSRKKYTLANMYIKNKLFSDAKRELKECIKINSFFVKAWLKYILIYYKKSFINS